jgi:hypothetical protein
VPKKERRLIKLFKGSTLTSKLSSGVSTLFMSDSLALGFDGGVVNNDAGSVDRFMLAMKYVRLPLLNQF